MCVRPEAQSGSSPTRCGATRRRQLAPLVRWRSGRSSPSPEPALAAVTGAANGRLEPELGLSQLLHQLNNELSIVLAHAELLEAKAVDDYGQSRATQVVGGTLAAMTTVKAIRDRLHHTLQ